MNVHLKSIPSRGLSLPLPAYQGFVPPDELRAGKEVGGLVIEHVSEDLQRTLREAAIENANPIRFDSWDIGKTSTDTELFRRFGKPQRGIGFVRVYQLMERSRGASAVGFGEDAAWHAKWCNWTYVRVRNELKAVLFTRRDDSWILGSARLDEGFRVGVLHLPLPL